MDFDSPGNVLAQGVVLRSNSDVWACGMIQLVVRRIAVGPGIKATSQAKGFEAPVEPG